MQLKWRFSTSFLLGHFNSSWYCNYFWYLVVLPCLPATLQLLTAVQVLCIGRLLPNTAAAALMPVCRGEVGLPADRDIQHTPWIPFLLNIQRTNFS